MTGGCKGYSGCSKVDSLGLWLELFQIGALKITRLQNPTGSPTASSQLCRSLFGRRTIILTQAADSADRNLNTDSHSTEATDVPVGTFRVSLQKDCRRLSSFAKQEAAGVLSPLCFNWLDMHVVAEPYYRLHNTLPLLLCSLFFF